jgi:hypothetical protein
MRLDILRTTLYLPEFNQQLLPCIRYFPMHIFHKKISTYISDYIGTSNVSLADVRIISRKCHFKGFPYRTIIGIISDEIRNIDCIEGRSEMH